MNNRITSILVMVIGLGLVLFFLLPKHLSFSSLLIVSAMCVLIGGIIYWLTWYLKAGGGHIFWIGSILLIGGVVVWYFKSMVYGSMAASIGASCFLVGSIFTDHLLSEPDIETARERKYKKQQAASKNIKSSPVPQDNERGVNIGRSNHGVESLSHNALNRHCLIIGSSGSGKTVTIGNIIESAIMQGFPVIFVDGKGDNDLYNSVRKFTQKLGVRFLGLSGVDPETSSYNPLSTGDFTSKKDRVVALREWSEDHYRILAEGYLQTAFKVLEATGMEIDMVKLADNLEFEAILMAARETGDQKLIDEVVRREGSSKQISSLIAEIDNLASSAAGVMLDTTGDNPVIELGDVIEHGGVAMFSINKLQFPQFGDTLGKLIINDLKALAGDMCKTGKRDFYVVLDEFSSFAGDQALNLINMGRSAGAHIILGTQTLSDTDAVSEQFTGQILGSVSNFIVHSLNNPDDAERVAALFGTRDASEITHQIGAEGATGTGSLRSTKKFLVHPDEIKNLDVGEAYIFGKVSKKPPTRIKVRKSIIN